MTGVCELKEISGLGGLVCSKVIHEKSPYRFESTNENLLESLRRDVCPSVCSFVRLSETYGI